ncbi:RND family efflux transporter MFP subunit [Algoriphagus sp. 4150]|uniref:efflux RND transporter periplasmic adaptor subunit n=1 Tax=Algoriphagus sp. 4150 TaxID=2817756 RepID=UPI0028618132|nr:efflux RND transporter periplasmic adaptor subunit [Algoriphagus sp. 4150]MDR7132452.1 RND family efflux transporter MFP subunit [Algoriphagus sp. 4150]
MKNKKHGAFYTALLFVATFGLNACKSDNNEGVEQKTNAVITEEVSETSFSQDVAVSGNIEGNKTAKLGFMVAGKISQINVAEGQPIAKNQLIAALDPINYSIAKEIADVQVSQATDEYNRLKTMYERKSISESDFNKIDFTLQGAKAQQKLHSQNLSDTKLHAPFSGVLLRKLAETGEIVASGMPVLVVSDISTVKVNAYIPENQLNQISIGQSAQVRISALNETVTGKVTEVGSVADATTRAFTIKIEVANPTLSIRPGMIAEVSLPSSQQKSLIAVPASAILRTPEGRPYIFVSDNGHAFQRDISVGGFFGDRVEIISGLSVGETIVTGGQQRLTNGSNITITNNSIR